MLTLQLFDGKTGAHVRRINMTKADWSDSMNEDGSISATAEEPRSTEFREYGHIIAAMDGMDVVHAGYLKRANYSEEKGAWTLDGGGALSILEKRLVINHALDSSWTDGNVVIDEENPSGDWPLHLAGSYSDIISGLLRETLKWGTLPIVPAALTGGSHERNYNSYDLATVAGRIEDIGDLHDGPETRFDASIGSDGALRFDQVTSADGGEIVTNQWSWNTLVPNSGVIMSDEDFDGEDSMCSQSYGTGGRSDDKLLVARSVSSSLTDDGWPVLQVANKEHSTVSQVETLKSYVTADTMHGDKTPRVCALKIDRTRYAVKVGDHARVRYGEGDDDVVELKVTDVSGSSDSPMLEVQCRERD